MVAPTSDNLKIVMLHKNIQKGKEKAQMLLIELKAAIHKMVDAISDKSILIKIYTFIKYLK